MSFFNQPDWDQQLFNKFINIGDFVRKKGYANAWFSWLQWVGITALLFLAAEQAKSILVYLAAVISVILLFVVALSAVQEVLRDLLINSKLGKAVTIVAFWCICFATPAVVIDIIKAILSATGT